MAFWGVQVKPGKSFTHKGDDLKGRLHISMATLGVGSAPANSRLQCNVGNNSPVYLCSLSSGTNESLQLNLEFEEADDVTFSVIGPRSIHLCGYYLGSGRRTNTIEESESYGEDIANTETDRSNSSEDEYEDSFIDDDANPAIFSGSPILSDGEASPVNKRKGSRRRLQKKHQRVDSDDDALPISSLYKSRASAKVFSEELDVNDDKRESDASHKNGEDEGHNALRSNSKSKAGGVLLDTKIHRDVELPATVVSSVKRGGMKRKKEEHAPDDGNSYCQSNAQRDLVETDIVICKFSEGKNKDLQQNSKDQNVLHRRGDNGTQDLPDVNQSGDRKMKKRRKKGKSRRDVEVITSDTPQSSVNENIGFVKKDECVTADAKPFEVKTLPNGLVIQELEKGNEDGEIAVAGKKISVLFTGKLKDNGEVFESNIGYPPYKFRLGKGRILEGWDVGLEGMRTGGKRRVIIPPSMGFGSEGHGTIIPPNSWLVYEFKLVTVYK